MIRLRRGAAPRELDAAKVVELTAEYKTSQKSVWNTPYIRDGLVALSDSKCAYCETNIAEESKYMEVEHFRCKDAFPDQVVEWSNLLPSCKRCNVNKGAYNIETEGMIVDPFADNPSHHFYFHNYRLRGRDEIGRRSIETLYLNDSDRLVYVRMQIGEAMANSLEKLREDLDEYRQGERSTRRRNRIVRGVEALLKQAQPQSQFSALAASVLLVDADYIWIKDQLANLDLWTALADLDTAAASVALTP